MMLQLNPTIPVYSCEHKMNGYAFVIQDYSQEHYSLFLVGLDNGEFWWINQKQLRLQPNISLERKIDT